MVVVVVEGNSVEGCDDVVSGKDDVDEGHDDVVVAVGQEDVDEGHDAVVVGQEAAAVDHEIVGTVGLAAIYRDKRLFF